MKKFLASIILAMLPAMAHAQTSLDHTTCPGAGCVIERTDGMGSVGIQVTGTFVGTLQFEQTIDGSTWTTLTATVNGSSSTVTSATATGFWNATVAGSKQVRVRFSAYTSGTAVVTVGIAQAKLGGGSGGGTTVTDATITVTDVTTNNASASAHGWLPKESGFAYDFFTGAGTYTHTMARGTITADDPFNFTQTWNNGAVSTFNALVVDVTQTAGSGSLFSVRRGGVEQAKITSAGALSAVSIEANTTLFAATHQVAVGGTIDFSDGSNYNMQIDRSTGARFRLGTVTTSQPFKFSQTWNAGGVTFQGFTIDVTSTASAVDSEVFRVNQGSQCMFNVGRSSSGTSCFLSVRDNGETHVGDFHVDAGHLTIPTTHYVQDASSLWWVHSAAGAKFQIGSGAASQEYVVNVGAVPTMSGCGTGATIVGNNSVGRVTIGTGPGGACTLTFGLAYTTNAPHCDANNETAGTLIANVAPTTSAVVLTASFTNLDKVSYHCVGFQAP